MEFQRGQSEINSITELAFWLRVLLYVDIMIWSMIILIFFLCCHLVSVTASSEWKKTQQLIGDRVAKLPQHPLPNIHDSQLRSIFTTYLPFANSLFLILSAEEVKGGLNMKSTCIPHKSLQYNRKLYIISTV